MLTPDRLRWAEALQVEKRYGRYAADWTEERITALGDAGDQAGVARMREIRARLDQLDWSRSAAKPQARQ